MKLQQLFRVSHFNPVRIPLTAFFSDWKKKQTGIFILLALIRTPNGKCHTPIVDDNQDGTVSIKYQPSEIGLHELDVFYQGQPIAGSPFKFHVDKVQTGYVTAYGPGLSHGVCNEPCNFRIVTKDAGSGGLSVAVEGSSKAEIQCKDNKDGTCDVTYYPVNWTN